MDFEVTLPPSAQDISPVLITSPASHNGTSMLQQAICRSENAICYGDNLFEELLSIIEWATTLIEVHQDRREAEEAALERALQRDPVTWMPDAAPAFDTHMSSIFSTIYNIPHTAQEFARENGRDHWAVIRSGIPSPLVMDLLSVFPNGRAVFIHRNPFDAACDLLRDAPDADLGEFCESWNLGMEGYLRTASDRLTKLRFEDASSDAAVFVEKLAVATGASGVPIQVLTDSREAEMPDERVLSEDERAAIATNCADMIAVYYPELA